MPNRFATDFKIVSGGQTGADRAALDWAIAHDVPHGGWCPRGRMAEDGAIAECYALQETATNDPSQRTEWNVRDSDGTVIFSIRPVLAGGSKKTLELAQLLGRPVMHLCKMSFAPPADQLLIQFIHRHHIRVLNVAGPRASEEEEVGQFVRAVLDKAFGD